MWPIDETLTGTMTPGLNVTGSNGKQIVLLFHTPQRFRTGASLSDAVEFHTQDTTPQELQSGYPKD